MYEIFLMNKNGEKFSKIFNSKYLFDKFFKKVKHGNNLKYLGHRRIN